MGCLDVPVQETAAGKLRCASTLISCIHLPTAPGTRQERTVQAQARLGFLLLSTDLQQPVPPFGDSVVAVRGLSSLLLKHKRNTWETESK